MRIIDHADGSRARAARYGRLRREIILLDDLPLARATRWIEVWRGVDNHRRRLIRAVRTGRDGITTWTGSIAAARRLLED